MLTSVLSLTSQNCGREAILQAVMFRYSLFKNVRIYKWNVFTNRKFMADVDTE